MRLAAFIEDKRRQPFDWRRNNCAFFACDWIAALTGRDHARSYRRRVKDEVSAIRVLKAAGGVEKIAAAVCTKQGWPEIAPAFARRGDVVSVRIEKSSALGVCVGDKIAFASRTGLAFLTTAAGRRAWRIA